MVKEIVKYEAEDGTLFDTEIQAIEHERVNALSDIIAQDLEINTHLGWGDCRDVAKYLARNYYMTKAVK